MSCVAVSKHKQQLVWGGAGGDGSSVICSSSCSWCIYPSPWPIFASCNFNVFNFNFVFFASFAAFLISISPEGLNGEDVMQGRMGAEQM